MRTGHDGVPLKPVLPFLLGGGTLGTLIAEFDWAATSLGPITAWPQSLKTSVSIILRSQVPMVMLWGEDGIMIYNDAYSIFAANRHPKLLGSKVREGWPEVADFNDHVMNVCLAGGTLAFRDQELLLHRSGAPEPVWMNLDYSPILGESGQPEGVIAIVIETTAKVAAERWLMGERERQRQMFEQAPGFMAMLSGPYHVVEMTNAAYMQLVGHRDILGKPVREALPEVEGQGFFELLDQVFTSGEPFIGTSLRAELQRMPNAPKEERFMDLVYQPVRGQSEEVIGIFVQGFDVTDRLAAEDALRRSEVRFRTFAEAMPNHVWTARPDGMLDWFNPRVLEYSGLPSAELEGEGWASMVHEDDLPNAAQAWARSLASGVFYETEFRLRRRGGDYRWHIARAVPIRDDAGGILNWIGTNTDIDDQKSVTQALSQSERRLQLSQIAAGIASLELDIPTGDVVGSAGFWDLWGLTPRDSVHISVLENLVIPDDRDIRSSQTTREQGTAVRSVEYRIRRADTGELRWLSRHIDFVHDAAGKPIKMFGVMQDITDQKEAETRQQMLTHELEHRIKNILSMVAAIASQTLRNATIETARAAFDSRLRALADAHDILNNTRWTTASMVEVVEKSIAVFPAEQIDIDGPALAITPKMALSLALAVNELATNAVKYGALSVPGGRVKIAWSVTADGAGSGLEFKWSWREAGGPPVQPPQRRGFGSVLIERLFAADFNGAVRIDYEPEGVVCMLQAPWLSLEPAAGPLS